MIGIKFLNVYWIQRDKYFMGKVSHTELLLLQTRFFPKKERYRILEITTRDLWTFLLFMTSTTGCHRARVVKKIKQFSEPQLFIFVKF